MYIEDQTFLWWSIACRRLKNALKRHQKKGNLQTPSPYKALKTAKSTRSWQRDPKPTERTLAEGTLQGTQAPNLSPSNQSIGDVRPYNRTTKRTCQNRHRENQSTASRDKHTICHQDMKRTNISDRRNSHWPFANAGTNIDEVERGQRETLFQCVITATTSWMMSETKP